MTDRDAIARAAQTRCSGVLMAWIRRMLKMDRELAQRILDCLKAAWWDGKKWADANPKERSDDDA